MLPNQLTARNITITVRTIVRGLSYLLTFLFAANTVGLTGEALLSWNTQLTVRLMTPPGQSALCAAPFRIACTAHA